MSGIDEQTKPCVCFDREDDSVYWTIAGSSGTLGYINNKHYLFDWGGKTLTVYRGRMDSGIDSFVSMIRHFRCSKCYNVYKQYSPEFDKLIRLVYASFKEDGWGAERNT